MRRQDLQLLVRVGGVLGVQVQHAHQLGRQVRAFEDAVPGGSACRDRPGPPAGSRRPPTVPARRSPVRSSQMTSTRRSRPTRSCFVVAWSICSRSSARQAREVALALVGLDDGAHRHRVLRIGAQDLLVDLDGARRVPQLLAVELRHTAQDLGALPRIGLRRGLALQQRGQPVPALGLEQQPALRLARPRCSWARSPRPAARPRSRARDRRGASRTPSRSPPAVAAARRSGSPPAARARTRTRAGRPAPPSRPSRGSGRRRRPARAGSRARPPARRAGRRPPDRGRLAGRDTEWPAPASCARARPGPRSRPAGARAARRASRTPVRRM